MDHVHRGLTPNFGPSFERRAECIKLLVDAGFANRIFLSQDTELGGWLLPDEAKTWREKAPWDPPEGLLFVPSRLIPYLRQIGVSDRSIHTITIEHPKTFFSRV
jgi:predicted metal-dependent phosphotriesterase family hydrolase